MRSQCFIRRDSHVPFDERPSPNRIRLPRRLALTKAAPQASIDAGPGRPGRPRSFVPHRWVPPPPRPPCGDHADRADEHRDRVRHHRNHHGYNVVVFQHRAATARQTLQSDIQTIELASGTTIGQLTAIHAAFQTLAGDGLQPSSSSALSSFEDSLVKSFANGTTLTGNATLLAQFEALYTSSPTTQQTTDLTTAYNALAAAVTSSNITSSDLSTIDADFTAVLAAESSTSTATFPYFSLVTGRAAGPGGMEGGCH